MRLSEAFSDVTVGTLIVMIHARLADRISGFPAAPGADATRRPDRHQESSHRRGSDHRAYVHPR